MRRSAIFASVERPMLRVIYRGPICIHKEEMLMSRWRLSTALVVRWGRDWLHHGHEKKNENGTDLPSVLKVVLEEFSFSLLHFFDFPILTNGVHFKEC